VTHAAPGKLPEKPPIETKVKAATAATYLGVAALLAVFGVISDNPLLISGLPDWVEALIIPLVPTLITFLSAYNANHTYRPDLTPPRPHVVPPEPPPVKPF
jgi:hypothetical protein